MTNSTTNERIDKVVREALKKIENVPVASDWNAMEKILENQPNRYKVSFTDVSPYLLVGVLGTIITGVLLFFILRKSDTSGVVVHEKNSTTPILEAPPAEKLSNAPAPEAKKVVLNMDSIRSVRKADSSKAILNNKPMVAELPAKTLVNNNAVKEIEKTTNNETDSSKSKTSKKSRRRAIDSLRPTTESINVDETLEIPSNSLPDSTSR